MKDKIYNILKEYCTSHNISSEKIELTKQNWFEIADNILKKIDIKDLYIEPIINDIEKIKILRLSKNNQNLKTLNPNVNVNANYTEKICTDIKTLTFYSLYPSIIIKLVDYNALKIKDVNYYTLFKYLFVKIVDFKNTDMYRLVKSMINYYYGIFYNNITFKNFDIYKHHLYESIINNLEDNLIYYDTDTFYYFDDNYTFNYDLPYEIEELKEFIVFRKKKTIEIDYNHNIKYKGFRQVNKK